MGMRCFPPPPAHPNPRIPRIVLGYIHAQGVLGREEERSCFLLNLSPRQAGWQVRGRGSARASIPLPGVGQIPFAAERGQTEGPEAEPALRLQLSTSDFPASGVLVLCTSRKQLLAVSLTRII